MSLVVRAARGWIGTPFAHQGRLKGVGCDCLGLILGVWAELGGSMAPMVPAYTPDWDEPSGDESLWRACAAHLRAVETPQAGDVMLFRMHSRSVAKHLGVFAPRAGGAFVIHAVRRMGVVETTLGAPMWRRFVAAYRLPDVET